MEIDCPHTLKYNYPQVISLKMIATFTRMMIAEVSSKMRETATPVTLTPAIRAVLTEFTNVLDKYACTAVEDHDSS